MSVLTIAQRPASIEEIEPQLLEHFGAARAALLDGDAVVLEVAAGDLLGHGDAADGAVACAMVGLARALALEGARAGWVINVVATDEPGAGDAALLVAPGLSGEVVHDGRGPLGRVPE